MHRIDTKTAQKDKFGAGKNGFTRGNPQTGTPATDLDDDYFDMLQEELCSVVEASGASLEKGRHDQLLTALRALLLSRKNPFGDIKSDGTVKTALENLGLGEGSPAIGVPFFWPSAAMPNTVIDSWSSMVFLKFNGAKFSATDYPVLAKVFPSLVLPEARGDFIRIWDDGRGADGGRELLSWQAATNFSQFAGNIGEGAGHAINFHDGIAGNQPGFSRFNFTSNSVGDGVNFVAVRPRNIAFNFLVRLNNEPVFDENGLATVPGDMRCFYYDAETSEYTGWSDEYINTGVSMARLFHCIDPAKTFREKWQYLRVRDGAMKKTIAMRLFTHRKWRSLLQWIISVPSKTVMSRFHR